MWEDNELKGVEFIPEPTDSRILSATDPNTIGHQEGWRSEVLGWDPEPVPVISRQRRNSQRIANTGILVLIVIIFWAVSQYLLIDLPPPTSEWAFEEVGARDLQDSGLTGSDVRVCMVDTGIDTTHPDLAGVDLVFKDFISGSSGPVDYGLLAHGTMMAGILVADGYLQGVAPRVTLGMAAALGEDGSGGNSGDEELVANAIEWCWRTFEADIISLSLGGESDPEAEREGPTTNAVRLALANGVYVVAAAGNDGGVSDDGRVSTPSNVAEVISVAALERDGTVWSGSSIGAPVDSSGDERVSPHLKPEISAPGVGIISTAKGGEYYSSTGTSDATVFVSGILALILEAEPNLKDNPSLECITQVKEALMVSAESLEADIEHDSQWGYGSIDGSDWLDEIRLANIC
ncbi:MAG: S8 family serine peptidase [Euryarchaeota archaeon]|nr:S8 family serine peptidase [Euryarchaeota archaeon]